MMRVFEYTNKDAAYRTVHAKLCLKVINNIYNILLKKKKKKKSENIIYCP